MKLIIIAVFALVAVASTHAQGPLIGVLRDDSIAPVGAFYRTSFETENGIKIEEEGSEGSVGQTVVRGSYSYTSPEGEVITINYVADENGYRAEGPSVPTLGGK